MKTSIKFNSKIPKLVTILTVFSLISSSAFAQMAFVNPSVNVFPENIYITGKSDIIAAFMDIFEIEMGEEVFIEEWMANPFEFYVESKSESDLHMLPEIFIEEELKIENWMTDPDWNTTVDEELTIEYWMISPQDWHTKK